MKLSCDSTAFIFFRLGKTSKQLLSLQLGSLGLVDIQNDAIYDVQVLIIDARQPSAGPQPPAVRGSGPEIGNRHVSRTATQQGSLKVPLVGGINTAQYPIYRKDRISFGARTVYPEHLPGAGRHDRFSARKITAEHAEICGIDRQPPSLFTCAECQCCLRLLLAPAKRNVAYGVPGQSQSQDEAQYPTPGKENG